MSPEKGFAAFLLLTILLLAVVVATGYRERRRAHLASVALALSSLALAIYFAERMGAHYDLASAGAITPVHLWLAKIATVSYALPIATGWLTIRDPAWRPRHRICAFLVLALTLATAVTGTWMLLAAERLPAAAAG